MGPRVEVLIMSPDQNGDYVIYWGKKSNNTELSTSYSYVDFARGSKKALKVVRSISKDFPYRTLNVLTRGNNIERRLWTDVQELQIKHNTRVINGENGKN